MRGAGALISKDATSIYFRFPAPGGGARRQRKKAPWGAFAGVMGYPCLPWIHAGRSLEKGP